MAVISPRLLAREAYSVVLRLKTITQDKEMMESLWG